MLDRIKSLGDKISKNKSVIWDEIKSRFSNVLKKYKEQASSERSALSDKKPRVKNKGKVFMKIRASKKFYK